MGFRASHPDAKAPANEAETEEALSLLLCGAKQMGWALGVPKVNDEDSVMGLIVGTEEYVEYVTDAIDAYAVKPPWGKG